MHCPHCGQEHPDSQQICPNTGLPLSQAVVCANCGQAARPGSRFCAACGKPLPRPQPPAESQEPPAAEGAAVLPPVPELATPPPASAGSSATHPTVPAGSQKWTRPSVSLVKQSRNETRPGWMAIPTSPRLAQQWARQSRRWQFIGYALLTLVLLAGAAGLFLLWNQLRPQPASLPAQLTDPPALAARPTQTALATQTAMASQPPQPTARRSTPVAAAQATRPATSAPQHASASATPTSEPAALAEPSETPGALPPSEAASPSARLAFYSTRDQGAGIYVIDLEQPDEPQLLPLPEGYDLATWPAFCGEQVAFEVRDRALTLPRWIYLYDLGDQSLHPLRLKDFQPLRLSAPTCSPDGRYLAVSAYLEGDWELVVTELASQAVIYHFKSAEYPRLSHASMPASGEALWWMGTRVNGFYDINRTQDYRESQPGPVQPFAKGKYPAVSPDGSRVAFYCGNLLHLCVARADTGEILYQIPVSYFKQIDGQPVSATAAWSSDGQWLYFTSSITGNWDIYRVRPDGSQVQNLTEAWRSDEFMPTAQ